VRQTARPFVVVRHRLERRPIATPVAVAPATRTARNVAPQWPEPGAIEWLFREARRLRA
jgi:hypothetical protein